MPATETLAEARREMEICNACRYCEGFCAVFPAMELKRAFAAGDLHYLANLCHDCKACYYACQYAPPHEFAVNVPKAFAELRRETYAEYAFPRLFARLFARNGLIVSLLTALLIAALPLTVALWRSPAIVLAPHRGANAFYAVIPWGVMSAVAAVTLGFSLLSLAVSGARFWRGGGAIGGPVGFAALGRALTDVATLRHLGGGGGGCNDRDGAFSRGRRYAHHALVYGFLLCVASTSAAAVYADAFGRPAPYPLLSLPVILGTLGGVLMLTGTASLLAIKLGGDRAPLAPSVLGADYALIVLLFLAALSGLVLLAVRETAAMGLVLAVHLGLILALFLVLPYGKMVHAVYRSLALLRAAAER